MSLGTLLADILGDDVPVRVDAYDGTSIGPDDAATRILVRSPDALRRMITAPGELGLARAYVAGDLDIDGDVFGLLALRDRMNRLGLNRRQVLAAARLVGGRLLRPLPPPPEEARLRGRRHSVERDAAAIAHHYDVSNRFYRMVLGPTMTYSCAVFAGDDDTLEDAQDRKHELVCSKLALEPGMRLLDVGCGWGGMVLHAARHYGVRAVGVTLSRRQYELARERVAQAGLAGRVDVRLRDYRAVADGPYDAISSIGMFEHVGQAQARRYFEVLHGLLRPGGRILNHAISRPPGDDSGGGRGSFLDRYVFPDGELLRVDQTVGLLQDVGLEARHMESLREHYGRTLRHWVANLEAGWHDAVAEVGAGRARVWRLYMAGAAVNFSSGRTQVHQVLATRTTPDGRSGMPWRPDWEPGSSVASTGCAAALR